MSSSNTTTRKPKLEKKRKREEGEEVKPRPIAEAEPVIDGEGSEKKKKKRKRNKQNAEDANDSSKNDGIDEAIGKMDGPLLADFLAQKAKRHNKDLTGVELNDLYIPESAFMDTSSWDNSRRLDDLSDFVKAHSPKKGAALSKAPEVKGSPHTLVITAAGLRAADLTRALRAFQNQNCAVAKLFAKHIKLKEAKQYVENTRMGFGIGTPVRVNDLVDSKSLKLEDLKRIVIDGSYIDQKKRGIFDMKETYEPLLNFLKRPELKERYGAGDRGVQILVF